jgi:hypothetical protein
MSMSFSCPKCDETFRRVVVPDSDIVCPTCGWKLPHRDDSEPGRAKSADKRREGGRGSRRSSRHEDEVYDPSWGTKGRRGGEEKTLGKWGLAIWLVCGAIYVLGLFVTLAWGYAAAISFYLAVIFLLVYIVKYHILLLVDDGVLIWLANCFVPFFGLFYLVNHWGRLGKNFLQVSGCALAVIIAFKWGQFAIVRQEEAERRGRASVPAASNTSAQAKPAGNSREPIPNDWMGDPGLEGKGQFSLSDLREFGLLLGPTMSGWDFGKNGDLGDRDHSSIVVNGVSYSKGLGMHPPEPGTYARSCYALSGKAHRFKGSVALNGKPGGTQPFDIDVTGVKVLPLLVYVEGQSNNGCHAVWLNPVVVIE